MFNPQLKSTNLVDFDLDQYQELTASLAKIDRDSVENELSEFPATFSYYYGLMVRSKKNLDNATFELESFKSCYKTELRKNAKNKLTVDSLNDMVSCEEEVKKLNNTVTRYEEIYGLMRGICFTLEHKKDMLVQISANKRQEIKLH